jgi:hypothetical protein
MSEESLDAALGRAMVSQLSADRGAKLARRSSTPRDRSCAAEVRPFGS